KRRREVLEDPRVSVDAVSRIEPLEELVTPERTGVERAGCDGLRAIVSGEGPEVEGVLAGGGQALVEILRERHDRQHLEAGQVDRGSGGVGKSRNGGGRGEGQRRESRSDLHER